MMGANRVNAKEVFFSSPFPPSNFLHVNPSAHHTNVNKQYPTMTYRNYILKHAQHTHNGTFYCNLCRKWVNKHRWLHFKVYHRYAIEPNMSLSAFTKPDDKTLILLLLGANNAKPIPSLEHLKAEMFLCRNVLGIPQRLNKHPQLPLKPLRNPLLAQAQPEANPHG